MVCITSVLYLFSILSDFTHFTILIVEGGKEPQIHSHLTDKIKILTHYTNILLI